MSCYVVTKGRDGAFLHWEVPEAVWFYVQQLEGYIRQPDRSKLLGTYPEFRLRWIPVEEALPEPDTDVLAWGCEPPTWIIAERNEEGDGLEPSDWDQHWWVGPLTHWMPLPEPPR